MQKEKLDFLTAKARKLRDDAIEIIGHFGVGHIGPKIPKSRTATA